MTALSSSVTSSEIEESCSTVPPIGIAIPTFNRADVLLRCFQHLEAQTWSNFEVAVVDDGSTDETPRLLERYAADTPLRLRWVRQQNAGPAGARNHAVRLLAAPICLMIGDDILAAPDLVEKHLAFHRNHPVRSAFALGYTRWGREGQTVTPFMQWLEDRSNLQFAYADLLAGTAPTWEHFYTSNLSGKTALLRAEPFREGFTHYGMEDIELGYRLFRRGEIAMHFLPDAVGEHIHPTDVNRSCRRMMIAGYATQEFFRAWPEQAPEQSHPGLKRKIRHRLLQHDLGLHVLRLAAGTLTRYVCPNFLLKPTLMLHHEAGWRRAQATQARTA